MERKAVSGMMLTLLMMAVLTSLFSFSLVKATPAVTVTIESDGTVDPDTAPIDIAGDVYTFTGNITYPTYIGILVKRNNIVIDGAGYVVEGNGTGKGFRLENVSNVTIKNTNIEDFAFGVYLVSAVDITISGNNVSNNDFGIYLLSSSDNKISGNNITNNKFGIGLYSSSDHNSISGNQISNNNGYAIGLFSSSGNVLSGNVMNGNKYNLHVGGDELSHFMQTIYDSNLVDGKPVYYLINQTDLRISSAMYQQVGYLGIINSGNVTVEGLTLTRNRQGLLVAFTNNSRITNNNITDNLYGIWLFSSFNNGISGNHITNNEQQGISHWSSLYSSISENHITNNGVGISLDNSSHNNLFGNNVKANNYDGVLLDSSSNYNSLSGNNVTENNFGISLSNSSYNSLLGNNITANNHDGIVLDDSSYNDIFGNNITWNYDGIFLEGSSNHNIFSGNNVTNNDYGVYLDNSSSNSFFHNNFIDNNILQVDIPTSGLANFWDNGEEGNYWSDYEQRYPDAEELDNSGIWDTPYVIDVNNTDNYPLMEPYSPPQLYTLTILSSPIGVAFTVDTTPQTTPWSETYTEGTSVDLVMPETHDGYSWTYWLEDGDTNRIRTVIMNQDITLTGVFTDITPPIISLVFPGNRTYTESSVPLFFTLSEPAAWIGYSLDGAVNVTITENTTLTNLLDGMHHVVVFANDTAGNMGSSDIVYFTVQTSIPDTFPPTVVILSPKNKTYTTTDIALSVIADETVSWMGYSLDNQPNVTITEGATLSGLTEGIHSLIAYANDTAGNMGSSDIVYFTVDTVSPNIVVLSPENKTYTASSVSLSFTLDEPTSWIGYSLDGQANVTITGNITLSDLSDGSHSLIVYATDTVGNIGASEIIYFTINTQQQPEPFSIWIVAAIVAVITIIAAFGTAVYHFKIRKKS